MEAGKSSWFCNTVFLLTLIFSLLTIISVIFPALITTLTTPSITQISSFELGESAIPLLSVNIFLLGLGIISYTNHLPIKIYNLLKQIREFDISPKLALCIMIIIFVIYIAFSSNELSINELSQFEDFRHIEESLNDFPYGTSGFQQNRALFVKNFLLIASEKVFHNIKIMPFIGSISLLLVTYFFAVQLAKKRLAGIIAVIILIQSPLFLLFDTSATYDNFWTSFYILSLFLIYKRSRFLSPLSYVLSFFSKPLTLYFLPFTLLVIFRTKISKRNKTLLSLIYIVIFVITITSVLQYFSISVNTSQILPYVNHANFFNSFATLAYQLRLDIVIVLLLPTIFMLLRLNGKNKETEIVMLLICAALLSGPLLESLSGALMQPYRNIPLLVFVAIGASLFLTDIRKYD